jgi:5-dehydro-2-deoxygluconokinase
MVASMNASEPHPPVPDALDVVTIGRVGVDLYPEQVGVSLASVLSFSKSLGGSPTNVAVAAARLGLSAAVVTKVGDDGFGEFVRAALERFGVHAGFVSVDPTLRTPLVFCEMHPPERFPLLFYREPRAPDANLGFTDLPLEQIVGARLFWTSGTGLSMEPSRSTTLAALEARGRGVPTVHDLDYRPNLWSSLEEARRLAQEAIRRVTVVVGNEDEIEMAIGEREPYAATQTLIDMGVELAICKRGGEGVVARTADGSVFEVPPLTVNVVNGLGAGDAFGGALCCGLVNGWDPERTLRYANAAGAFVAARMLCADEMPKLEEIEALLDEAGGFAAGRPA